MKTLQSKHQEYYPSLQIGRRTTKVVSTALSLAILNLAISCSYYTVRDVPTTKESISQQVKTFNETDKYVIIHSSTSTWHLKNMVIDEDNQTISGTIEILGLEHQYKKPRESKRVHRYDKNKTMPFNEVHFYLKEPIDLTANSPVTIPLSDIASISVNDTNTGRAVANVVLGTVGALFVVLLIVAATKSSCPFVYIKNGENFDFVGELYPGMITANMQKDDYLPLGQLPIENDNYTLKISNVLKEVQYTDFLQLLVVNHDANTQVLMDGNGQMQTFQKIEAPTKVIQDDGLENVDPALKKDNDFYAFNTIKASENSVRHVVFEFDKPQNDTDAKFYLTAKNSAWLDYVFGKFNEQFGSYYNTFQKNQQKVDAKTITDWSQGQNIPLSVYLKTTEGWQLIEQIHTVGPMAMRDIVVPLQLNQVEGDKLQIKLETGFMFWEVDYVGVDFSENSDFDISYISPSQALDQNGMDVTQLLTKADGNYFVQPKIGDEVVVNFPSKPIIKGQAQSTFLKNRGYYNYIRDYKGSPDFEKLKTFKEDNAFTKFSEKAYFEYVNFDYNEFASHE